MFAHSQFVFRLAAILLLLVTGSEMLACDLSPLDQCERSGAASQNSQDEGCCICCCAHIVLMDVQPSARMEGWVPVPEFAVPQAPAVELARIYHPPKF